MELMLIESKEQGQRAEPDRPVGGEALEFGRFRVLLRQRQLLADGMPVELGSRAFDILMALIDADGALVMKEELLSRAWPGIVVTPDSLKVQISALRAALGEDRDVIRTEFGRGYRFTAAVRRFFAADREPGSAPEAIEIPTAREAALTMGLSSIAAQLACLEDKLAEMIELLDGRPAHDADQFRRHNHSAVSPDCVNRRRRFSAGREAGNVALFRRRG